LAPELFVVKADPAQLEQVLVNLAVNARDAMAEGGTLTLRTRNADLDIAWANERPGTAPGPYAELSVIDTGHGMDDETQTHIFEPFFTTKGREAGTGLGLATVYGIIRQSDGHIDLTSQVGEGTAFRVYLPRSVESLTEPRPSEIRRASNRGSETILLVEDEPLVRQALGRMLRRLGYNVLLADGAEQAIRLAESGHEIDLVVTDVIMPTINGTEMVRRLRSQQPTLKVIYISGYTDGALSSDIASEDFSEFLQKPIPHDLLASKVRSLLDRRLLQVQAAGE
jgi:CheY-like chemotaxis protein